MTDVQSSTENFYYSLPPFSGFQEVVNPEFYYDLPQDWFVVLTDIKGSTKAIQEGRYKEVNVVGVSTIIAVQNACGSVEIPFVFGGDGSTVFVPSSSVSSVKSALNFTRHKAQIEFQLDLRIGIIPVKDIYQEQQELKIAKMKLSESGFIAMVKGSGLSLAEKWLKSSQKYEVLHADESAGTHKGLECRWNPIQSTKGTILTLMLQARGTEDLNLIYKNILAEIREIVPQFRLLEPDKLSAKWPPKHLMTELKIKYNGFKRHFIFLAVTPLVYLITIAVRLTRQNPNSAVGVYLESLSTNTDFVKFDDMLRMVLDVSDQQKNKILNLLEDYRKQNKIYYGTHSSTEALMTCYVQANKNHVHFIDGGSGGYALAAQQMKEMKQ